MRRSSRETQSNHIRDIGRFATFPGRSPDTASADDLRRFQVEQRDAGEPAPTTKVGGSLTGVAFEIRRCYTLALSGRTAIPPSAVEIEGKKPRYASILSAFSAWLPRFCTNAGRARFGSSPWKAAMDALAERNTARCRRRETGWRRADEAWRPPAGQLSPRRNSGRAPLQGREGPGFAGEAFGQAQAGRQSARMPGIASLAALPPGADEVIE